MVACCEGKEKRRRFILPSKQPAADGKAKENESEIYPGRRLARVATLPIGANTDLSECS